MFLEDGQGLRQKHLVSARIVRSFMLPIVYQSA